MMFLYFQHHLNMPSFFIDDVFVLFASPKYAHSFREYKCSKHHSINFSIKNQVHFRYWKSSFVVKTVNFLLYFIGKQHLIELLSISKILFKRGLICKLSHITFSICNDFKKFHSEIDRLKINTTKSNYPLKISQGSFTKYIHKIFRKTNISYPVICTHMFSK